MSPRMSKCSHRRSGRRVVPSANSPGNRRANGKSGKRTCPNVLSRPAQGRSPCGDSAGVARSAASFFFPLDHKLGLGTEGYSPRVLQKAVRQAAKAPSFKEASEDLRELAEVAISATHLQRLSHRVGNEWAQARDEEVQAFRENRLVCS